VKPLTNNTQPERTGSGTVRSSIHQKLNRILHIDQPGDLVNPHFETENNGAMITKVVCRPNPFHTSITLDVTCGQSKHVIVRMFDDHERIIKMFSWFLVKGINVTTMNEVSGLVAGTYLLDIVDLEGDLLYNTKINKSE
jgi:hypothetical protein